MVVRRPLMFLSTISRDGRWCEPLAIGATHWVLLTYDNSLSCHGISKSFFPMWRICPRRGPKTRCRRATSRCARATRPNSRLPPGSQPGRIKCLFCLGLYRLDRPPTTSPAPALHPNNGTAGVRFRPAAFFNQVGGGSSRRKRIVVAGTSPRVRWSLGGWNRPLPCWCGSCTAAPAYSGWQYNCHPNIESHSFRTTLTEHRSQCTFLSLQF